MSRSEEYESFDGLFTTIASGVKGIEPLMDAFFGFLGRKTDFYQASSTEENLSRRVTLQYFEKHRETALRRYEEEKERNKKLDDERKRRAKEELNEYHKRQAELAKRAQIEEVFDDDEGENAGVKSSAFEKQDDIMKEQSDNKLKKEQAKTESSSKNGTHSNDEDDDSTPPIGNGGTTDKYVWTQTLQTVDMLIHVDPGTTSRQCKITMTPSKLRIEVRGKVMIDGVLHDTIKSTDSLWTLEDNRLLHLTLEKKEGMKWWSTVMKGDAEINTQRIIPENSKISDLDPDLRQTVEKMMYDQEMKQKGLPTSEQTQQAKALEAFKKAHPEMDFSKAKINWGNDALF